MAGRNLYDILEVARNAAPELIATAYRLQCDKIKGVAVKEPERAAALRTAADEAFKTLSNPQLRAHYDLKLQQPRANTQAAASTMMDDRSWLVRHWPLLLILLFGVAAAGYFYDKNKKEKRERIAAERRLEEEKAALARERVERAAEEAARQANEAALQDKLQRDSEYAYQQKVRAQATADMNRRVRQEERDRKLAERQQLMEERKEEAARLKQENDARLALEREKRRLRQLQCARGAC